VVNLIYKILQNFKGEYMKKQIMSIAAAAALFTTGAMAFDYTYDGEIVADITTSSRTANTGIVKGTYASYKGGEQADTDLKLSTTNRGDALVYPAFRAGDAWSSTIVVRNSKKVAVPCKVVLYAADNSRELLDFDIFLSPFDVFRFNIAADGTVSTNDGSFALIDPTLATDKHKFVKHNGDTQVIGKINARAINKNVTSGYAVIYAMAEATNVTPLVRLDVDGKPALGEADAGGGLEQRPGPGAGVGLLAAATLPVAPATPASGDSGLVQVPPGHRRGGQPRAPAPPHRRVARDPG